MLSHTPKGKPVLEVIPDNRFIVFHGDEHNAEAVKLTGVVRLTTTDSMSIKGVKISLEGRRRVGWYYMGGMSGGEVSDKRTFFDDTITLGTSGTHKINKGVLEWPFEFELQPSMAESVEGMASTWVVYHLNASVARPGWNAKDITKHVHVRIVRTLGAEQMGSSRSRTNQDIWANKISYSISIPTDAVVFGTSIVADVELSPLRKGITLGKVDMRLSESTTKRIQLAGGTDQNGDRVKSEEAEVAKADMDFPEDSRVTFEGEDPENMTMEDERYRFKAVLPLPKSLKECRQDVDTHCVTITHKFKLMVNINNPEGHISQLVCRLPVKLFISPNLPVDESNMVQATSARMTDAELNDQEAIGTAPPEYGRHQLDELYSDIIASGFMSHAPSGHATPHYGQSRRGSAEGLQSLGAMINDPAPNGEAHPALLQSRLANLQNWSHSSSRNGWTHHSPSGGTSPYNGLDTDVPMRATPPQRTWSGVALHGLTNGTSSSHISSTHESPSHSTPHTPLDPSDGAIPLATSQPHEAYDLGTLSRVPSYGAAVRSTGPHTPFTEVPPSYFEATSRPPSPPQRPSAAHVRGPSTSNLANGGIGAGTTSSLGQLTAIHEVTSATPTIPSGTTPLLRTGGHGDRAVGGIQRQIDEEARLRVLRARAGH